MDEAKARPLYIGGFTIDDLIVIHLTNCTKCRDATKHRARVRFGQKTRLCDEYLHLQLQRANYEGSVNNIVAYTELGDEAPKLGRLE